MEVKTMEKSMSTKDYNLYLAAIKAANDTADKESLRQIQKRLLADYGLNNNDVRYLISRFRYNV